MSDWGEVKLQEITTKIGSGATPRGGSNAYKESGIPIIRSQNVLDLSFTVNGLAFIDNEQAAKLNNVIVEEEDLLLNITGDSVARICKAPKQFIPARVNQHVAIIRIDKGKSDSDYILYYLQYAKPYLLSISEIGGTRRALTKGMIEELDIPLPPLPKQKAIASVLSSLDDKIDLLHCQNKTLEAMAETLFRQWFVEEADESWEEGNISDLANHERKTVKPQNHPEILYEHYSIPSFDDDKKPVKEIGSFIKSNKYEIPKNCVLFSKLNPHKDKRIWLIQEGLHENSICSTEFQIVLPINSIFLHFIYGWLSFQANYNEIASGVGGTSGSHQRINPSEVFNFRCPIIPKETAIEYRDYVKPLFYKQFQNQTQIRNLTSMRERLLPKLMSGEVKVEL